MLSNSVSMESASSELHLESHQPWFQPPLWQQRRVLIGQLIQQAIPFPIQRVLDAGCGEGMILSYLSGFVHIERLLGVDQSMNALKLARERMSPTARDHEWLRERPLTVELYHGSLTNDLELSQLSLQNDLCLDLITCAEVVEHIPIHELPNFSRQLFQVFHPRALILTTPNAEFNVLFTRDGDEDEQTSPTRFRDADHKFEWTRAEFEAWCQEQADMFGYSVSYYGVGVLCGTKQVDPTIGHATQAALFLRQHTENTIDTSNCTDGIQLLSGFELLHRLVYPHFDEPEMDAVDLKNWLFNFVGQLPAWKWRLLTKETDAHQSISDLLENAVVDDFEESVINMPFPDWIPNMTPCFIAADDVWNHFLVVRQHFRGNQEKYYEFCSPERHSFVDNERETDVNDLCRLWFDREQKQWRRYAKTVFEEEKQRLAVEISKERQKKEENEYAFSCVDEPEEETTLYESVDVKPIDTQAEVPVATWYQKSTPLDSGW